VRTDDSRDPAVADYPRSLSPGQLFLQNHRDFGIVSERALHAGPLTMVTGGVVLPITE